MAIPFYPYSYEQAQLDDCIEAYQQSMAENQRFCKYVADQESGFYANAYKNYCVDSDGKYLDRLIEEFGMGRTEYIFANTISRYHHDGRISSDVMQWAKAVTGRIGLHQESDFLSRIHPGVMNILAANLMQKQLEQENDVLETDEPAQTNGLELN